ncbi:hypothetical protein HN51_040732 [Arachis hypogaea]
MREVLRAIAEQPHRLKQHAQPTPHRAPSYVDPRRRASTTRCPSGVDTNRPGQASGCASRVSPRGGAQAARRSHVVLGLRMIPLVLGRAQGVAPSVCPRHNSTTPCSLGGA